VSANFSMLYDKGSIDAFEVFVNDIVFEMDPFEMNLKGKNLMLEIGSQLFTTYVNKLP